MQNEVKPTLTKRLSEWFEFALMSLFGLALIVCGGYLVLFFAYMVLEAIFGP